MPPGYRAAALAICLSVIGVAADTVLKQASLQKQPFLNVWFALGVLLSGGFAVVWVHLMHSMKMATAGLIYAVLSALLLVLVGITIFGERLSPSEATGIAMAMGALVLLGRLAV